MTVTGNDVPTWCPECAATIADAVRVAAMSGLRLSELCNLQWADIENGRITVTSPKGSGRRVIPVMPALREVLLARRMSAANRSGYVFTRKTQKPYQSREMGKALTTFLKHAGMVDHDGTALKGHDLRRVFLVICQMCRVPDAHALFFLGHSSCSTKFYELPAKWEWLDLRNQTEDEAEVP